MKFKYYHGTSTIFLKSIRDNGLGKINPNTDFKNLDVLIYLKNLCEKFLIKNSEYIEIRDTTLAMAQQSFLKIKDKKGNTHLLNYKHDGIYVAISMQRAAIYASLNKYGSEILERCIILFNILKKDNIEFKIPNEINLFKIENYINYESKPIIIEIDGIDDDKLEKENGEIASDFLESLRKEIPFMSEKKKFEYLQFCNFKILEPIEPKRIKFYELEYEGFPGNGDFEITLSKI
ncbi:hypothetical protein G1K66_12950 [Tenacibaculum finnmarkense]|uniref:hypothetical protein n=1 Tax=Tenacibaculum finnmarkense TaxID=2781243 RepID=UPI001E5FE9AC|nr:hypothetical protein [Tenacibaculum finnmarkense]MCD8401452.1 hypothetical protein [Tenacibaculum finnmarkense genomovar ulcerans]MCG8786443.1 hypothetical protein [Tenacibaculum finnmarkense]MCG8814162.1 hypothetical protein [Tenacibaculum finnmarkense]